MIARDASPSSSSSSSPRARVGPLEVTLDRSGTELPSFARMWSIAGCSPAPPVALIAPAIYTCELAHEYRAQRHTFDACGLKAHGKQSIAIGRHCGYGMWLGETRQAPIGCFVLSASSTTTSLPHAPVHLSRFDIRGHRSFIDHLVSAA